MTLPGDIAGPQGTQRILESHRWRWSTPRSSSF